MYVSIRYAVTVITINFLQVTIVMIVLDALVEERLEVLYGPIRYKMAMALNNWHPSDSSAHKILEPWLKVRVLIPVGQGGNCEYFCDFVGFLSSKHGNVFGTHNSSKTCLLPANGIPHKPTAARNWLVAVVAI